MQITLNQSEIEKAIITYVGNQGISITGKNVDVTLIAGRGPNGMTASIDISNDPISSHVGNSRGSGAKGITTIEVSTEEDTDDCCEAEARPEKDPAATSLFGS